MTTDNLFLQGGSSVVATFEGKVAWLLGARQEYAWITRTVADREYDHKSSMRSLARASTLSSRVPNFYVNSDGE